MTGDDPNPVVADCENCHVATYFEPTESESLDGPAWKCTGCGITVESIQGTIRATARRDI